MRLPIYTLVTVAVISPFAASAEPFLYPSPQDAVEAFGTALAGKETDALLAVFGPDAQDLLSSGDAVEDRANRIELRGLYRDGYRFQPQDDGSLVLALGADGWPFPVPLVRSGEGWSFDVEAGRDEVAAREIGLNELDVIELMDGYVDVQAEFRLLDHDGDGVMEFARQIVSSENERDGLFWPGQDGPVGELLARASAYGFNDGEGDQDPEPYLGYFYRILTGQTDTAPGGALSYLVNGNMLGGHALLAVPADYDVSGVQSFLVSENGIILEADLGEDTLAVAAEMELYDPGTQWTPVE